jgi:hypothetical protein
VSVNTHSSNCVIAQMSKRTSMKNNLLKYLAVLALVPVISIMAASCGKAASTPAKVNQDVIASWSFSLDAASVSLTTKTSGTIFAKSNDARKNDRKVVISARVEIDPADWGGVSFSIPKGWEVSAVTSDYPQGEPNPESHTSTIYTGSTQGEYQRIVEIGNTKHGAAEPQGGVGSVIIELVPMPGNQAIGDSVEIGIAVGSSEGYIAGPVTGRFMVSFD